MGWGEGDNIGGQIHAVTVFFKILPLGSPIIWSSIINTSTLGGEGLGNDVECGVVFSNGDVEWKIVKSNENGLIQCFDCTETFSSMGAAKRHFKIHMTENKFLICKICNKFFSVKARTS